MPKKEATLPKNTDKTKANSLEILPPEQPEIPHGIQWVEETRRLSDLRPFEQNPRKITKEQFNKLKQSIVEDGYHSRIKITNDGRMIGGHQRRQALQELGHVEVKVLRPDRPLTDRQFIGIMIRDNHSNGVFDMDMLANMFDLEDLRAFGLHDITGLAPEDDGELAPPKNMICCPECGSVFPAKGNKAT